MSTWSSFVATLSPDSWWRCGTASGNLTDSGSGGRTLTKGATGASTFQATSLIANDTSDKALIIPGGDSSGNYGFVGGDYYDFSGTASFTIVAFIKPDGSGSGTTRRILEKISTNGWRVAHSAGDKVLFQRITSAGTSTYTSTSSLSTSTTYMVTCRYDGTNMAVFINDTKDATGDLASSYSMDNTAGSVSLGCTSSYLGTFGGTLDEAMVFSSALSDANIAALYAEAQKARTYTADALIAPNQGTLYGSGTQASVACGSDIYGQAVMVLATDSGVDGVKLERSSDNSTWTDITSTTMTATSLGSGNWKVVDRRPQYGTQSVAYGGTAYYRASPKVGTIVGPASTAVSVTSTQTKASVKALWYSTSHAHISARTEAAVAGAVPTDHYTSYGELQIGQWLMAMADAYRNTGTASYLTDCQNQWDYIKWQVTTYGDGKFIPLATEGTPESPTYQFITMDGHFRPILHALQAARLIALVNPSASIVSDIRSYCDQWLKNAWDLFKNQSGLGTGYYSYTWAGWDADNQTAWQSSHAYTVGDLVRPTTPNGRSYRCYTAGTSAGSAPTWPTSNGGTVTDGSVVWKETSRTVTKFKYQYYNKYFGVYTDWRAQDNDSADAGATIVNKELVVAAAHALALQDCASFTASGTYRTAALAYVAGVTDWVCSTFSLSDGSMPYAVYTGYRGKSTSYGAFNVTLLAIISKLGLDTTNQWQTIPIVEKTLDWLSGVWGSEPYTTQTYLDGSATSTMAAITEMGFARAGYFLRGRDFTAYDNVMHSAAWNDPTSGQYTYPYTAAGGGPAVSTVRTGAIYGALDQFATLDSILTTERAYTADALIKTARAYTADAVIAERATRAFTADAVITASVAGTVTRAYTADAVVIAVAVTMTSTFTADAVIATAAPETPPPDPPDPSLRERLRRATPRRRRGGEW